MAVCGSEYMYSKSQNSIFESIGLFSVNPPTSRDLCETYVLPVLLYSSEHWEASYPHTERGNEPGDKAKHWVINHQLIEKLESLVNDSLFTR